MDQKKRQAALDNIPEEDIEKIRKLQPNDNYFRVDESWLILTEFAMTFGWDAYQAARNDEIKADEMYTLLEASRKINNKRLYERAEIIFMSIMSSKSKRPGSSFKRAFKSIVNNMKADEE